jgi:hypothetical protein
MQVDIDVPMTVKMSDIEPRPATKFGINVAEKESNPHGNSSIADNVMSNEVNERREILQSEDSSESYSDESSSLSEASTSGFEEAKLKPQQLPKQEAKPKPKPTAKSKSKSNAKGNAPGDVGQKSNRKIASESVMAAEVGKADLAHFESEGELSDANDRPTSMTPVGGETNVRDEPSESTITFAIS